MSVRRYVRNETAISIVANVVVSALFAWLIFHDQDRIPLWGARGMAFDLVPTTFMITLMSTFAITLVTRARARQGLTPALSPTSTRWSMPWLPRNVIARALLLAILATLILVPLGIGAFLVLGIESSTFVPLLVFKMIFGAALALLVSPIIVLRALLDGR